MRCLFRLVVVRFFFFYLPLHYFYLFLNSFISFYIKFVRIVPHQQVCGHTLFLLLPSKYPCISHPSPIPLPSRAPACLCSDLMFSACSPSLPSPVLDLLPLLQESILYLYIFCKSNLSVIFTRSYSYSLCDTCMLEKPSNFNCKMLMKWLYKV